MGSVYWLKACEVVTHKLLGEPILASGGSGLGA